MRHIERWFSLSSFGFDVFVRDGYVVYATPSCFPRGSIKLEPFKTCSDGSFKNVSCKVSWLDLKFGFPRGLYIFG